MPKSPSARALNTEASSFKKAKVLFPLAGLQLLNLKVPEFSAAAPTLPPLELESFLEGGLRPSRETSS